MKIKRFLAGLTCCLMIFNSGNVVAFADTSSTPAEFIVTASMLDGDLFISIPDSIPLSKNGNVMTGFGEVTAQGVVNPTSVLSVSTDEQITYVNQSESSIKVNADVSFGTDGVAEWTASELKANIDSDTKKSYTVTATVPMSDIEYIGEYASNVVFNISLNTTSTATTYYMGYNYTDSTSVSYTNQTDIAYDILPQADTIAELKEFSTDKDAIEAKGYDVVVESSDKSLVIPSTIEGNEVVGVSFDTFFANESIATYVSDIEVPSSVTGIELGATTSSASTTVITCENVRAAVNLSKKLPSAAKIRFRFEANGERDYTEFFTYNGGSDSKQVIGLSEYGIQYLKDNYNPTDTVDIVMPAMHPSGQPVTGMSFKGFGNANAVASELPYVSLSFPETYTTILGEWNGGYRGTNEFLATKLVALDFDGVEQIYADAFRKCTYSALKSITIPASVQEIGWMAFAGCTAVETITFEEGVGNIDIKGYAFNTADKVYLPSTMTSFGCDRDAFTNVPSIIYWNNDISNITGSYLNVDCPVQYNDALGSINGKILSCSSYDANTRTAYFTSESLSPIDYVEDGMYKHIVIDGAVTIPNWAFENTGADIAFTDASTITSIGKGAFLGKTLVGDIILGNCIVSEKGFCGATIDTLDIRNATCGNSILQEATVNTLYAKDTQLDGSYEALSSKPTINNIYIDYSGAVLYSGISTTITGDVHFSGTKDEFISFLGKSSFDLEGTVYYGDGTSEKSPYAVDKENVAVQVAEFEAEGKSVIYDVTALSAINKLAGKTVDGLVTTSTQFAQSGSNRDTLTAGVVYIEYVDGDRLGQSYDGFYATDFGTIYFTGTEEQWDSFATSNEAKAYKTDGKVVFNASLPDSNDTIEIQFISSIQ